MASVIDDLTARVVALEFIVAVVQGAHHSTLDWLELGFRNELAAQFPDIDPDFEAACVRHLRRVYGLRPSFNYEA